LAHTCPVCGQACYCNGDIDDIFMETKEAYINCTHCDEYADEDDE
jgi:C4-type Zn-finger protein